MDRNDPESLKRILDQMITRTPLGKTLEQARIWEHWPHVAGQDLAGHGEPVAVKKGVLRVAVENAAWMQSFFGLSSQSPDGSVWFTGFPPT